MQETNLEEGIHVLLGAVALYCRVGVLAHHVINGPHNLCHFLEAHTSHLLQRQRAELTLQRRSHLSVYVSISVNVIKMKRPLQLLPQSAPQQNR